MQAQRTTGKRENALVLNFHGLGTVPKHVGSAEQPFWCPEELFSEVLDLVPYVSAEAGLPIRITFDDGNDSDARIALPALAERGLTAQFFICAGRVGERGYLDKNAITDLVSSGMTIGSHGWAHVDWRHADNTTLRHELYDSLSFLADTTGQSIGNVAVPFGSYDRRVLSALKSTRARIVYTSDRGIANERNWIQPRETWTVNQPARQLHMLAQPRTLRSQLRSAATCLIKRLR